MGERFRHCVAGQFGACTGYRNLDPGADPAINRYRHSRTAEPVICGFDRRWHVRTAKPVIRDLHGRRDGAAAFPARDERRGDDITERLGDQQPQHGWRSAKQVVTDVARVRHARLRQAWLRYPRRHREAAGIRYGIYASRRKQRRPTERKRVHSRLDELFATAVSRASDKHQQRRSARFAFFDVLRTVVANRGIGARSGHCSRWRLSTSAISVLPQVPYQTPTH